MCYVSDPCGYLGHRPHHAVEPMYSPWFFHHIPKPPNRETQIKLFEQWLEWLRAYEKEIEEYIAELKEKE
jgi:hypothetical protein